MENSIIMFPYPPLPDPSVVETPDSSGTIPYQQKIHVFGKADYPMDIEENLGYRTPFLDEDAALCDKMFDEINKSYQQSLESPSTE